MFPGTPRWHRRTPRIYQCMLFLLSYPSLGCAFRDLFRFGFLSGMHFLLSYPSLGCAFCAIFRFLFFSVHGDLYHPSISSLARFALMKVSFDSLISLSPKEGSTWFNCGSNWEPTVLLLVQHWVQFQARAFSGAFLVARWARACSCGTNRCAHERSSQVPKVSI